jgi:glycosyltransferase involved in cell wall biosynthesis
MKIAFIHLNLSTESGDPRMFYMLIREIKKLGHQIVIYTAHFEPSAFPELNAGLDIRVAAVPSRNDEESPSSGVIGKVSTRMFRNKVIAREVDQIGQMLDPDFDVLVFQNDPSYELGVRYHAINPNARRIWIMNNSPFYHSPKPNPIVNMLSWLAAWLNKIRIRRFTPGIDLIVVHDKERGDMIRSFGVPVIILRIPVDFKHFFAPVKHRAIGDKRIMLLGVGTLGPGRKFEDIISAVAYLRAKGYQARATIVCKDFWHDAAYRESVIALTKKLGIEAYVELMFQGAREDALRSIMWDATVFVFASVINIWNMSSCEAMAAGLPVVASDATSLPEVFADNSMALFFKAGDPADIAAKVCLLVENPETYYAIASNGQRFVKENLDWNAYAKNFISAISSANR